MTKQTKEATMTSNNANTIHVTRIDEGGGVHGHDTSHCDEGGCAGVELYYPNIDGSDAEPGDELPEPKTKTKFIVQTAAAAMPSSCWGQYRKVAVLEVDAGLDHVSMISARARGCYRVVRLWDRLNVGKTDRCAYTRALREAEAMAAEFNETK